MALTSTRTTILAIHHPSARSAATMHRAMRAYTDAARAVLSVAQRDWETLRITCLRPDRQGRNHLNTLMLETALRTRYRARTAPYPLHSSLRNALFADLAAAIASYDALLTAWHKDRARITERATHLGLDLDLAAPAVHALPGDVQKALRALRRDLEELGRPPSWPSAPRTRPDTAGYHAALERITTHIPDYETPPPTREGPRPPRARLSELIATGTRPLWFPRADGPAGNRNFALLHTEDDKYYALLYLLPAGDQRCKPLAVPPPAGKRGATVALNKAGKQVVPSARPSTALCLPLACGRWHEETALADACAHPEQIRVARLFHQPARRVFGGHRPERFLLAVTIEQPCPDPRPITAYLGISMDDQARVGWCVRGITDGTVLAQGTDDSLHGLALRWREERRMRMREGRIPPRAHHLQAEQVRHATHALANRLLAIAVQHGALPGVQDVRYLRTQKTRAPKTEDANEEPGTRAPRTAAWHAAIAEDHYRKATLVVGELERILGYKGKRLGIMKPLSVGGISPRDCAACGGRGGRADACGLCGAPLGVLNSAAVTAHLMPAIIARIRRTREEKGDDTEDEEV